MTQVEFDATPGNAHVQPAHSNAVLVRRRSRRGHAYACALLSSLCVATFASSAQTAERRASTAKSAPATANGSNPHSYNVFGKRYSVLGSSEGYRERGVASWYGRPFHGRPTSNGEKYDMNDMTAAHKTLPLPTWVEVTNLTNGKRITVKVNDRGPFVDNRVIDLSFAAATALDIVRNGTARVEVRAVPPPQPVRLAAPQPVRRATSQPAVALTLAQPDQDRRFAQAGNFTDRADAVELVAELKAQGLVNAFIVTEDGRRRSLHRVRVGPLADDAAVAAMGDRLRGLGAKRSRNVVMP